MILVTMTLTVPGSEHADTFRPVVRGLRGAVAAGGPLAVEAGMRTLRAGGNAVDAGVAATFAAAVTEFSHFGLGAEASILYYLEASDRVVAVNADGPAPMLATPERFAGQKVLPGTGILAATVPSVVDGLLLALREDGSMSFEQVIAPAIEHADGFPVGEILARIMAQRAGPIREMSGGAETFLPGGKPPVAGEVFKQPALAATLRGMVAAERAAAGRGRKEAIDAVRAHFYRGPIAKAIGEASEKLGGLLRATDLERYQAKLETPVSATYRGWEIYKVGFWSQGPVMLQTLGILEAFDIAAMKQNSASYVHTVTEAMKLAFADRDRWYADPSFVRVPATELLSKEYARARAALIDPERASAEVRPGQPVAGAPHGRDPIASTSADAGLPPDRTPLGTTCINVVDAAGNLWSATPSGAWLPSVIAGSTGIPLSQRMQAFSLAEGHPNRLAPGKLPRYTLTPTLARRQGERPSLAFSTPGLDVQDQTLLQVFLNIADFGLGFQEALEAPRFDTLHLEETFDQHRIRPGELRVESRLGAEVIEALRKRGHIVEVLEDWGHLSAPTLVAIDRTTGVRSAAADPRRGRYANAH